MMPVDIPILLPDRLYGTRHKVHVQAPLFGYTSRLSLVRIHTRYRGTPPDGWSP
jgi:hypothetical protein